MLNKQILNKVLQKDVQNNLYKVLDNYIPQRVLSNKNRGGTWLYGYNEKYNFVNISKTGRIGEIINISGLRIGLPLAPKECYMRSEDKKEQ